MTDQRTKIQPPTHQELIVKIPSVNNGAGGAAF